MNRFGVQIEKNGAFFYVDNELIASICSEWLQRAIDVLMELFERMGLRTNMTKAQAMTCMPGYICTNLSHVVYCHRTRGNGNSHRERQRRQVECSECGKAMAAGLLSRHLLTQHGIDGTPPNFGETMGLQQVAEY